MLLIIEVREGHVTLLNAFERAVVAEVARQRQRMGVDPTSIQAIDRSLLPRELDRWTWSVPEDEREARDAWERFWAALRESATTLRVERATAEERAGAWLLLLEFAQEHGIKPGPPPSIRSTNLPSDLIRVNQFDNGEMVEAVAGEIMSGRLENLDRTSPLKALRGNVQKEAHRHYVEELKKLRASDRENVDIAELSECIDQRNIADETIVLMDLNLGLRHLARRGLPRDAALLIRGRFSSECQLRGLDADVARTLGWTKRRLKAAQASLRQDRWGGVVRQWFLNGGYVPFDPRRHRRFQQEHGRLPWEERDDGDPERKMSANAEKNSPYRVEAEFQ